MHGEIPDSIHNSADVSVVITTFEQTCFLSEAIRSVLAQTIRCREIIVIDDGSSDSPERVTDTFEEVRLIRQPNRGLSSARNAGLKAAKSRYVVFLDADDRLLPEALESNLSCFAAHPNSGLVYGAYYDIDEEGRRIRTLKLREIGDDPFLELLPGNMIGMHATVMYRRDCLLDVDGFDTRLKACEDFDIFLRIARHFRFACHATYVAEYRRHGSNMSNNAVLMISAALSALRKHKSTARTEPNLWLEYRRAKSSWKEHYAKKQAIQLHQAFVERKSLSRNLWEFAAMLKLMPIKQLRALSNELRGR
ncbi:MAG: glycosyltransferase [Xanthomonadales bacterium]|nr:glycosyltransferase [Xanthomonadales bacterium]